MINYLDYLNNLKSDHKIKSIEVHVIPFLKKKQKGMQGKYQSFNNFCFPKPVNKKNILIVSKEGFKIDLGEDLNKHIFYEIFDNVNDIKNNKFNLRKYISVFTDISSLERYLGKKRKMHRISANSKEEAEKLILGMQPKISYSNIHGYASTIGNLNNIEDAHENLKYLIKSAPFKINYLSLHLFQSKEVIKIKI